MTPNFEDEIFIPWPENWTEFLCKCPICGIPVTSRVYSDDGTLEKEMADTPPEKRECLCRNCYERSEDAASA
jgi:hypothetical protein